MVMVYGRIRDAAGETRAADAEGETYEAARDALRVQAGDGEQLLSISRWPV